MMFKKMTNERERERKVGGGGREDGSVRDGVGGKTRRKQRESGEWERR